MDATPPSTRAPLRVLSPWRGPGRLAASIGASLIAFFALPPEMGTAGRLVAAWDVGAILMLTLAWRIIWTADVAETRRRAASQDTGRTVVFVIVSLSSTVSLFAATFLIRRAADYAPPFAYGADLLIALSVLAVVLSWSLTHTSYTFRYAHLFYRQDCGEGEGGLRFPADEGCDEPDDFDFAYYAFTIGMCFQVSDVTITSKAIRRATLMHATLSFAYNTAILALALNLVFNKLG